MCQNRAIVQTMTSFTHVWTNKLLLHNITCLVNFDHFKFLHYIGELNRFIQLFTRMSVWSSQQILVSHFCDRIPCYIGNWTDLYYGFTRMSDGSDQILLGICWVWPESGEKSNQNVQQIFTNRVSLPVSKIGAFFSTFPSNTNF